ncbi:MAG: ribosome maturation factor RimM [Dermatophilus congolensis]|nr:ribosome maturation factor RimM [Dermatophilus congolensis]
MQVLVARIGRPHGLKGEVTVQVHTDSPDERFVVGERFACEPTSAGPLTLRSMRVHKGITLLGFEEAGDRTAAEALRGTKLFVDVLDEGEASTNDSDESEEGWYEDELLGLTVVTVSGETVGEVAGLLSRPAQDLLVVRLASGQEALVPFVEAIVPEVDPEAGRVLIDPPAGLLDLAGG